jgi:hypothetical protein
MKPEARLHSVANGVIVKMASVLSASKPAPHVLKTPPGKVFSDRCLIDKRIRQTFAIPSYEIMLMTSISVTRFMHQTTQCLHAQL